MQTGYDAFRAAPTGAVRTAIGSNIAYGLPFAYAGMADALQGRLEDQGLTGKGGIADVSGLWGAEAAGADVEYDMDTRPRYDDSAFLGFERGDQGLTSADTFEGINTLPERRNISEQVYDAQRREALAKLATEFEEGKIDSPTKEGWKPSWQNIRDVGSLAWAGAKKTIPIGWAMSAFNKFKPTDTMDALNIVSRGDPDLGKGLSGKVSWAGRAYDKEHGAGAYKQKKTDEKWSKIKDIDYQTPEKQAWKKEFYKTTTEYADKQKEAAKKAAAKTTVVHPVYGGGDGGGDAGGAQLSSGMTTGQHAAFRMAEGGRVGFSKGGIVDLWQELSNL